MTTTVETDSVRELRAGPMTRAERDAWPDDGRRHELIDGLLVVTPAPAPRHQLAVGDLFVLLRNAAPDDIEVVFAPLDVVLAEDTVVEPDLVVAPLADFDLRGLPTPPLLAIEVLSPSTRRVDLTLKKARYEEAGTPSYWVVDPAVPSITAWELHDGAYVVAGRASGDEVLTLALPFPITITPNNLADRPRGRRGPA